MKKNSTQVIEKLESLQPDAHGMVWLSIGERDWCVKKLKATDARDEQLQKPRKPAKRKVRR